MQKNDNPHDKDTEQEKTTTNNKEMGGERETKKPHIARQERRAKKKSSQNLAESRTKSRCGGQRPVTQIRKLAQNAPKDAQSKKEAIKRPARKYGAIYGGEKARIRSQGQNPRNMKNKKK